MKTKDRILDVAIALFNEHGTNNISTNHIAEAIGISPGNLYYHYANKQEIIRAIFERLFGLWDTTFTVSGDHPLTIDDVRWLVHSNFKLMREYQFIYRELIVLLRQDAVLHDRYAVIRKRGYDGFHEIIGALAKSGVLLVTMNDETISRLADLCWLISEFWLSMVEVSGNRVDDDQMTRGIDLMMQALRPYIAI
ncbi:MAG: TetR/AcrR family transcriptional regulator [bacterium]|nr:TetR/AcrR family transcriptional regulator [bacterium]